MTDDLLRAATLDDARLLWEWRNDDRTRQSAFTSEPVEWEAHQAWLDRKLASSNCRIWILQRSGCAVGQVRYDRVGRVAEIDFCVAPKFRRQGFGARLLELSGACACSELDVETMVGLVKDMNEPSKRAFERAGYKKVASLVRDGHLCWRFERNCPRPGSDRRPDDGPERD